LKFYPTIVFVAGIYDQSVSIKTMYPGTFQTKTKTIHTKTTCLYIYTYLSPCWYLSNTLIKIGR